MAAQLYAAFYASSVCMKLLKMYKTLEILSILYQFKQKSCFSTLDGGEVTELGRVGKSRRRREDDDENPDDSLSSEENEEDEIDEQRLRVAASNIEIESISHQAGSIVTFSKGGSPKEEMV